MELSSNIYQNIRQLLVEARQKVAATINTVMVETYWEIGRQIVEEEQHGQDRAAYGTYLIKDLSKKLTVEFGDGFGVRNL